MSEEILVSLERISGCSEVFFGYDVSVKEPGKEVSMSFWAEKEGKYILKSKISFKGDSSTSVLGYDNLPRSADKKIYTSAMEFALGFVDSAKKNEQDYSFSSAEPIFFKGSFQ